MPEVVFKIIFGTSPTVSAGNTEFLWRFYWLLSFIFIAGYVSHLYFGSIRSDYVQEPTPIEATLVMKKDGEYHIYGAFPLPSSCHGVSVRATQIDVTNFLLSFDTWLESARTCERYIQSQQFNAVIFTSEKSPKFSALVDGKMVPLIVTHKK